MEDNRRFSDYSEEKTKKLPQQMRQLKQTREKMELETQTFIEVAKDFTSEWFREEIGRGTHCGNEIEKIAARIPSIVETQLDRDEYWIHRKEFPLSSFSRDELKFKYEKIRRELNADIRMILGCTAELISDPTYAAEEKKVWVRERGRRKYVCILGFSEEMEASLNRYFTLLEELLTLDREVNSLPNKNSRTDENG